MLGIYIIAGVVVLCVLYRAWYKVSHPFWARQPVFHHHNVLGWLSPGRVVDSVPPSHNNKYYDKKLTVTRLDSDLCGVIAELLTANYSDHPTGHYTPTVDEMSTVLCDGGIGVLASDGPDGDYVGCITSCKALCRLKKTEFELRYVDNLCISKRHRGTGLAERLIYTLVSESVARADPPVIAFKREGATTPIVPLVLSRSTATKAPIYAQTAIVVHRLQKDAALAILTACVARDRYTCVIQPTKQTLVNMLTRNVIFVYASELGDAFVFRELSVEADTAVVQCVAAFRAPRTDSKRFRDAFVAAVNKIHVDDYVLIMDGLGDLVDIQAWCETISIPLETSTSAYYLYNYIEHPHRCDEVVVLV